MIFKSEYIAKLPKQIRWTPRPLGHCNAMLDDLMSLSSQVGKTTGTESK